MDAVLIGDGEDMTPEVTLTVLNAKRAGKSKAELLQELSKIRGVYIRLLKRRTPALCAEL
jgi:hypothetical protein